MVSGWGRTPYTKLGKQSGSKETTRCIQRRVRVHRFLPSGHMDATEGVCMCSIVGFLLGFSLASSYTAYRLVVEYKQASAILQASVEELQATTIKVGGFYREISRLTVAFRSQPTSSGSKTLK